MARKQDPAWLAAQYNNRARVPGHAGILARWARDSQVIRDTRPCQLDLAYGDTPAERLDVFRPSDTAREPKARRRPGAPMLVFIHGGWWRSLDKADHSFVAPALADAGAVVVVPNYALCPAVGIEDIAL
ncbi:MAG: alpha/beta hydrolase, partial [Rubrivivax sp.]|nr:alpha/beta hydrolase [Rubrivivax sp.]